MEYLYLNIHTGAYWTSTHNGKSNPDDWEENDWEKPVFRVTVLHRRLDEENLFHLSYYGSLSRPHCACVSRGWLCVSDKHRDRFRVVGTYGFFYQPTDYRLPQIYNCVIEPLDGTRMPEPGEVLDIIPEGTNAKDLR